MPAVFPQANARAEQGFAQEGSQAKYSHHNFTKGNVGQSQAEPAEAMPPGSQASSVPFLSPRQQQTSQSKSEHTEQQQHEQRRPPTREENIMQERFRLTQRMLEHDAYWQQRTNRLLPLPCCVPEESRRMMEAGNKIIATDLQEAVRCYIKGGMFPGGAVKEFVDNCAVQMLLAGAYKPCINLCTEALKLDPSFLPSYLHRARAYRRLQQWDASMKDFASALALGTPDAVAFQPDIAREAQLMQLERHDRENNPVPFVDHAEALGLSGMCTVEDITQAYRNMARKWHPDRWMDAAGKEKAVAKFHIICEAHAVLSDARRRAEWLQRMALRTPPHRRFGIHATEAPAKAPQQPAKFDSIDNEEQLEAQQKEKERMAKVMQEEQERRTKLDQEREEREAQRTCQERQKVLMRKLADDEAWQGRSNQPQRLPQTADRALRQATERAIEVWTTGDYCTACDLFGQVARDAPDCKEALDNYAAALLICDCNDECIQVCNTCLRLDSGFVPALLHRARALRCQQQLELAQQSLVTALSFNPPAMSDIQREQQLLALEVMDRKNNSKPPQDYPAILGLSESACTPDEVTQAYRQLAKRWHPDRWVGSSVQLQQEAAQYFQQSNEAYAILIDEEQRKSWQQQFAIRTPPHKRSIMFSNTKSVILTEQRRNSWKLSRRTGMGDAGEPFLESERKEEEEAVIQQAQEKREQLERDRLTAEEQRIAQIQECLMKKMLEMDKQWQSKTNSVSKTFLQRVFPRGVKSLVVSATKAMRREAYAEAADFFAQAMKLSTSDELLYKEIGDTCASALLLSGQPIKAVVASTLVLRSDAHFLSALLHRARAFRILHMYSRALGDLLSAITLATPSSKDISREAQLIFIESVVWEARCTLGRQRIEQRHQQLLVRLAADLPLPPTEESMVSTLQAHINHWRPEQFSDIPETQQNAMIQCQAAHDLNALLTSPEKRLALQVHFPEELLHRTDNQPAAPQEPKASFVKPVPLPIPLQTKDVLKRPAPLALEVPFSPSRAPSCPSPRTPSSLKASPVQPPRQRVGLRRRSPVLTLKTNTVRGPKSATKAPTLKNKPLPDLPWGTTLTL